MIIGYGSSYRYDGKTSRVSKHAKGRANQKRKPRKNRNKR